MVTLRLKPKRGGFLRPFGCGWFIREFLAGNAPYGSPVIDPLIGAPQADIFHYYKDALREVSAMDKATVAETKRAKREKRPIDPNNINILYQQYLVRIPYKANGCRYHSFVTYFSNLQRLGWVEPSGKVEFSAFQGNYPPGQPRKYYRLTVTGKAASDTAWANPLSALYG
jgi:hypothetical protein